MKNRKDILINEAVEMIRDGSLQISEYCRPFLEVCKSHNDHFKVWTHFNERQIEQDINLASSRLVSKFGDNSNLLTELGEKESGHARNLAGTETFPSIYGVPVAVKDIVDVGGLATGCGSPIYEGKNAPMYHVKHADASVVSRIKVMGGIVIGKTVTTEFATFQASSTQNPSCFGRTPGGSSSGSAAAVAAGMVPLAIGTQTAGSIIRPASYCGVVGFKPTLGTLDLSGVKGLARSFDTLGGFARYVSDVAWMIDSLSGSKLHRYCHVEHKPKSVGLCRSPFWNAADGALQTAWAELPALIKSQDELVRLKDVELPEIYDQSVELHKRIFAQEALDALHFEWHSFRSFFSEKLAQIMEQGEELSSDDYLKDIAQILSLRQAFDKAMGENDVLLTPSSTGEPPKFEEGTGDPIFNRLWSLLGVPAINVPGLKSREGLPVGIQVIARYGQDAAAISAAYWLESLLNEYYVPPKAT